MTLSRLSGEPEGSWEFKPIPDPPCAFCRESPEPSARAGCPRCRAIYHPDCWEANGGRCAVFGCEPEPSPRAPAPHAPRQAGLNPPGQSRVNWTWVLVACIVLSQLVRMASYSSRPGSSARENPDAHRVKILQALGEQRDVDAQLEEVRVLADALEQRSRHPLEPEERQRLLRQVDEALAKLGRALGRLPSRPESRRNPGSRDAFEEAGKTTQKLLDVAARLSAR